jgi:hypothetical protein
MKTFRNMLALSFIGLYLTSCSSTFYQVYKTEAVGNLITTTNSLIYEDDNCRVSYNLWGEGGDAGFQFYNKTDQEITVNLEDSFFIINGIAHDYYQDRVFTTSTGAAASNSKSGSASTSVAGVNYLNLIQNNSSQVTSSAGIVTSSGYSTAYNETRTINIPAKTSKIISEYTINRTVFRDCDLLRYPSKNKIKTQSFSKANSPIVFSNRISYKVGITDEPIKFENEFYITEITNYPESEILESKSAEFCGQKSPSKSKYFKNVSADKFYIKYSKGTNKWRH